MISQPVSSHFPLFSTVLWDLANSRPVHSLMLSSHLFLCLAPEGRPGMSYVSPLSGISGLSFDSTLLCILIFLIGRTFVYLSNIITGHTKSKAANRLFPCFQSVSNLAELTWRCEWLCSIQRTVLLPPKGGRDYLMSPPCLESQGCHLIPLCYLLSCSSA